MHKPSRMSVPRVTAVAFAVALAAAACSQPGAAATPAAPSDEMMDHSPAASDGMMEHSAAPSGEMMDHSASPAP